MRIFPRAHQPAEGAAVSDPGYEESRPPATPTRYTQALAEFYLNVAVVIKQYVLQLQVPVDHTILQ